MQACITCFWLLPNMNFTSFFKDLKKKIYDIQNLAKFSKKLVVFVCVCVCAHFFIFIFSILRWSLNLAKSIIIFKLVQFGDIQNMKVEKS
jgi:hypothetical protein